VPDPISIEVKGMEELQAKLTSAVEDLRGDKVLEAMRIAVLMILRDAKINAPVDTGRLRASITPEVVQQSEVTKGVVGSNVVYAPHQELGTQYMEGRRFLQHAFDKNAEEVFRMFDRLVGTIISQ